MPVGFDKHVGKAPEDRMPIVRAYPLEMPGIDSLAVDIAEQAVCWPISRPDSVDDQQKSRRTNNGHCQEGGKPVSLFGPGANRPFVSAEFGIAHDSPFSPKMLHGRPDEASASVDLGLRRRAGNPYTPTGCRCPPVAECNDSHHRVGRWRDGRVVESAHQPAYAESVCRPWRRATANSR